MIETWEPTMNLRIHRQVHFYEWATSYVPRYTESIQQEWRCNETGATKWEPLKVVTEEDKDIIYYG